MKRRQDRVAHGKEKGSWLQGLLKADTTCKHKKLGEGKDCNGAYS